MKRGVSWAAGVVTVVAIALLCLTGATSAQSGDAAEPFKPVSSVHGLMGGQGMVFNRLQQAIINRQMEQRLATIEVMAEVLAELSNVNQYHATKADYAGWARELRDAALALGAEAKKGADADDRVLRESLRTLKSTCGKCHDVYQK